MAVSRFLNSLSQELIGLDAHLEELSEQIEPYIDEIVQEYGLKCVRFSLAGLEVDNRKYDEIDQSQIASISRVKLGQGDKEVMNVLGEDWGRQQSADILGALVRNPGAGGIGAAGAGIGVGVAGGSIFGNMANQMVSPMHQQSAPSSQPGPDKLDPANLKNTPLPLGLVQPILWKPSANLKKCWRQV